MARRTCTITTTHCESCGSSNPEDIGFGGYSSCCNELQVDAYGCRDHHGQEARFQAALDAAVAKAGYDSREVMVAADPDAFNRAADAADTATF